MPACLENADQPFDAAIDRQDITYTSRRGREIGEVVERIDERQGRSAIESSTVIQGGRDAHGCLVDVWDTEIDFPHDENQSAGWRRVER
jgi:hypothetical protein